jgi:hypothetical protein
MLIYAGKSRGNLVETAQGTKQENTKREKFHKKRRRKGETPFLTLKNFDLLKKVINLKKEQL